MSQGWPVAELDPVRRLRVMASAAGAVFSDARVAYPPDEVWAVVSDLEGELPHLLPDVRATRVSRGPQASLQAWADGYFGQRARFDVELEPGWCWMESRFLLCGFAAAPDEGGGTRYAFAGGIRRPKPPGLAALLRRPGLAYAGLVNRRIAQRVRAARGARS